MARVAQVDGRDVLPKEFNTLRLWKGIVDRVTWRKPTKAESKTLDAAAFDDWTGECCIVENGLVWWPTNKPDEDL